MNRNSRLFVFIFIFSLCLFFPKLNAGQELPFANPEATISMDLQDASLKDVLKIFSIQSGLNFIASETVRDRETTIYLDKAPIKEAMDKLFKANNLSYELDRDSNIFVVKDWGKPQIETVTKVFCLKYATVSSSPLKSEVSSLIRTTGTQAGGTTGGTATTSAAPTGGTTGGGSGITNAIKVLLSEFGSVIEDSRTNSLVVTDIPNRMPIITQTIAALDVSVPQVMLEVEILDVNKDATDKIGFKFGQTPLTAVITGASQSIGFPFESWGKMFLSESNRGSLAINSGTNTYQAQLDFLRTRTDTKFLARPKLLTLNNETAEIKITTQEAVGEKKSVSGSTTTAQTTTTEAERYETGVSLRVTPQININTGEITMFIVPTVAEATASAITSSTGVKFYNPEVRTTKSIVRVKDAETIILGGLIRNKRSQTITKLPILGDLPLLGLLFRHKDVDPNKERELLVFITPHIIKDTTIELAQSKKVSIPKREQDTVSAVDREVAINKYLNSFERKKK